MNKLLMIVVGVLILISSVSAKKNRCRIKDFELLGNNKFAVSIFIVNHDTLAGFQIPFSFEDEKIDMTCDSISFIDSRCGYFDFLEGQIDNENKSILVMGIYQLNPDIVPDPLFPGRGLVAKAFFTVTNPEEVEGRLKKHVRFFKKKFKATGNTAEFGFTFWKPDGAHVESIYENNVIDIDDE